MLHAQSLKKKKEEEKLKRQMEEPSPRPKESGAAGVGPRRVCVVRVYLLFVLLRVPQVIQMGSQGVMPTCLLASYPFSKTKGDRKSVV